VYGVDRAPDRVATISRQRRFPSVVLSIAREVAAGHYYLDVGPGARPIERVGEEAVTAR
jgi:hypothetical protein